MQKNKDSNRKSNKKSGYKKSTQKSKSDSFRSDSFKSGPFKSKSKGPANPRPKHDQSKRAIKTFNPASFIKKVSEHVAAEEYVAEHTFADFMIDQKIKNNIEARGYKTPTPIQDQSIPYLLEKKDLVGTANTGTGKTAAFLIPLVHNILVKKTKRALIITPTRELAAQIQSELEFFKAKTGLSSVLCIGGLKLERQVHQLLKDPEFVIGTPGRLIDLENNRHLKLHQYDSIVLDEVDTMLDMGFISDIKYIISKLPKKRHSLFFSATISPSIKTVMDSFLRNPISVSVKTRPSSENVNQEMLTVGLNDKIELLHDILIKPECKRTIIFSRTKRATDKLSKSLKERGFDVAAIHGDKTQAQRKRALDSFKSNIAKILLATDVVARGIDIDDVSHVINYDLPATHEDYIHRIGRTGRANKVGQAITFI